MAVESDKKIARLTDHSITDRKNYNFFHKELGGQSMVLAGGGAILNYILSPLL